ncbi:DNA damage-inducible protein DIN7 [Paracoccidioides lutzii Pb01]|uniref:DNA damage-inducible protein DIN7 n=1 Tax=Paracoccidioides lutzii (strain ATCC MYA-826 / Pb01) TaxID=502779 RepID=C1GWT7_PARBA|nr:DNA damage-inducible protein DIN7 [Paracoccidioides lutzii Pb01]EEH41025.2 DNA damage-inducible protein DIN7 [Paracoccidioides lutzii Pb01]
MGIAGLHGLLKSIQKPCSLRKFKGQTLGVDAYGWLHRGTVACAIDLALDKHNTRYVDFAMNRVRMLLHFGINPYLVFDGDNLPSKAGTESSRAKRREESKRLGLELFHAGRLFEAQQELQKAIDVTPYMARLMIEELKRVKVQYIVAPYEADAQLVYLERQGIIDGIISEDSDMLVFGAKRLLSKLDKHGDCVEINRSDFTACQDISLIGWTDAEFRAMCILSGCDYLDNLPRMGLKTAYRNIRKYKTVEKTMKMIQFEGGSRVPPQYLEDFKRAEFTFLHQLVFCPVARKLVTLSPLSGDMTLESMPFVGADIDPDTAIGIACGDLDPRTKEAIVLRPSYPERSRLVRRQTMPASVGFKKPGTPINAYFTPKRVPLGELDPNSLTPSPSQQRLLDANTQRSWVASSAPARVSGRRMDSSASSSSSPFSISTSISTSTATSAPGPAPALSRLAYETPQSSERERFLASASTVSKFQPVKRQRLCSDADEEVAAASVLGAPDGERSRFFTASAVGAKSSPTASIGISGRENGRVKKARMSDFGVFSDEIVEGIMVQLPGGAGLDGGTPGCEMGLSPSTVARSDVDVKRDTGDTQESVAVEEEEEEEEEEEDNSTAACTTGLTQAMMGVSSGIEGEGDPKLLIEPFEYDCDDNDASKAKTTRTSKLLDRFAFVESKAQAVKQAAESKLVHDIARKKAPIWESSSAILQQQQRVRARDLARMTPLQRLRQAALHRSKSMECLRSTQLVRDADRFDDCGDDGRDDGEEKTRREEEEEKEEEEEVGFVSDDTPLRLRPVSLPMKKFMAQTEGPCLPVLNLKEGGRGSEDFIVPDSEEEEEGEEVVDLDLLRNDVGKVGEEEEKGKGDAAAPAAVAVDADFKRFLFTAGR